MYTYKTGAKGSKTLYLFMALVIFGALFVINPSLSLEAGSHSQEQVLEVESPRTNTTSSGETLVLEEPSPYVLGQAYNRNLKMKVQVTNRGEETSRNIRLEVPLLSNLDSPYQTIEEEVFSHQPGEIKEGEKGSRSGIFQIESLRPGESQTITMDYTLMVSPLSMDFNHYNEELTFDLESPYREPSAKIESDHEKITAKAEELTAGLEKDLDRAEAIYAFVVDHIKYDIHSPYRNQGALTALEEGEGVCEDYATLFAALNRALGIPARQVNGFTDPRGTGHIWNLEAGQSLSLTNYRHSWAEFYLEGIGWVPVDPTFDIYSHTNRYFGALPQASHMAQNYQDQSLRGRFQGGQLAVSWTNELVRD